MYCIDTANNSNQYFFNISNIFLLIDMEIGKLVEIPLPKLETTVRIQFEAPFCNVLKATIMTEDSDIATNCVAKLTEFPPVSEWKSGFDYEISLVSHDPYW